MTPAKIKQRSQQLKSSKKLQQELYIDNKQLSEDQINKIFFVNEDYISEELDKKNNLVIKIAELIIPMSKQFESSHIKDFLNFQSLFRLYTFKTPQLQLKTYFNPTKSTPYFTKMTRNEILMFKFVFKQFGLTFKTVEQMSIQLFQYFTSISNSLISNQFTINMSLYERYKITVLTNIGNEFDICNVENDIDFASRLKQIFESKPRQTVILELKLKLFKLYSAQEHNFPEVENVLKINFPGVFKGSVVTFLLQMIQMAQQIFGKSIFQYFQSKQSDFD